MILSSTAFVYTWVEEVKTAGIDRQIKSLIKLTITPCAAFQPSSPSFSSNFPCLFVLHPPLPLTSISVSFHFHLHLCLIPLPLTPIRSSMSSTPSLPDVHPFTTFHHHQFSLPLLSLPANHPCSFLVPILLPSVPPSPSTTAPSVLLFPSPRLPLPPQLFVVPSNLTTPLPFSPHGVNIH